MTQPHEYLKDIQEIRSIMDRSSRYIALSGMTGVVSGVAALLVVAFLCWYFDINLFNGQYTDQFLSTQGYVDPATINLLLVVFSGLFFFAISSTYYLTSKRAEVVGESLLQGSARKLWMSLGLPLLMGGGFCLALLYHGYIELLAPASLVFYGLTLYAGSKYTLEEVKLMGIIQMMLGIMAAFLPGMGLLLWALGFGVVHVVYGIFMYYKYER